MNQLNSTPSDPADPEDADPPLFPEFRLAVFDEGDSVGLEIGFLETPSILRHASPALLYGLAIMALDQQGVISATVESLLVDGPLSEIDASNRITLLLKKDANVEPV